MPETKPRGGARPGSGPKPRDFRETVRTKTRSTRLTEEMADWLDETAIREGKSASEFLARLLQHYRDNPEIW